MHHPVERVNDLRGSAPRPQVAWLLHIIAAVFLVSCASKKPPQPPSTDAEPAAQQQSQGDRRESVAITVYNQNFGLVREVRQVELGEGKIELEFQDVSAHIEPETVHIRSISAPEGLAVLEQNYRYDVLSPEKLLEKHVGKQVKAYRYNEQTGEEEAFDAMVLAVDEGVVLKVDGEVTYGWPGRLGFPKVPPSLISKPTLVWLLASEAAEQRIEVTYLTQNLNWKADYVFVINEDDTRGDLTGWVTLSNNSGTEYRNAKLKLVAGDVQRVREVLEHDRGLARVECVSVSTQPSFKEEGFFEYHLYTLQRPTTLRDKEQKQVTLLEAEGAAVDKTLRFYGAQRYFRGRYGQLESNQKVSVYLDLRNDSAHNLGMPLPKGTVRVYKQDKSGAQQFIGEDEIDHTPKGEELRIKMGEAFDIVGSRKQTDFNALGFCVSETAWEISLRNHKDQAETVEIFEPVGGDWTVLSSSHPAVKKDAGTLTFDVEVPANDEVKVTYRLRVRWC